MWSVGIYVRLSDEDRDKKRKTDMSRSIANQIACIRSYMEMLNSSSIIFTTTNPERRYVRASNIKPSNNLRLRYFRDITLGSDGEELYQETNSIEIAHAMRKIGIPSADKVEDR